MLLSKQQSLDIVSIFRFYKFDLIESSDRYICFCPFHADKNTPNLTIYPQTDTYYCFTCKAYGDALNLISFMEKIPLNKVKQELGTDYIRLRLSHQFTKPIDFYIDLLKDSSKMFYDILHEYPDKKESIITCMQKFDIYLNTVVIAKKINLDFNLYIKVLDNLKKLLYNCIN